MCLPNSSRHNEREDGVIDILIDDLQRGHAALARAAETHTYSSDCDARGGRYHIPHSSETLTRRRRRPCAPHAGQAPNLQRMAHLASETILLLARDSISSKDVEVRQHVEKSRQVGDG